MANWPCKVLYFSESTFDSGSNIGRILHQPANPTHIDGTVNDLHNEVDSVFLVLCHWEEEEVKRENSHCSLFDC